jgi:hypothetical protein
LHKIRDPSAITVKLEIQIIPGQRDHSTRKLTITNLSGRNPNGALFGMGEAPHGLDGKRRSLVNAPSELTFGVAMSNPRLAGGVICSATLVAAPVNSN